MKLLLVLAGLVLGAIIGGVLGLLLGIGALALPGPGPMIAAGSLATALGTASIGALTGVLLGGAISLLLVMFSNKRHSSNR